MPITDAGSHNAGDILQLGMDADDVRRQRHGTRTTFVRVADLVAESEAAPIWPPAAGEIRIVGTPSSCAAAVARVRQVAPAANGVPVSGFSLAELEQLAAREGIALRALLEELRAAGLELVAEAPDHSFGRDLVRGDVGPEALSARASPAPGSSRELRPTYAGERMPASS